MKLYLIINIGIIIVPILLSFESKIKYYKKISSVLFSTFVVGIPFIVWDSISTSNSIWSFNPMHVYDSRIFHLPIEEVLFFITVPYSILFLYETFLYYTKERFDAFNTFSFMILSLISLATAFIFYQQNYTFTILLFLTVLFLITFFTKPKFIFREKIFYFLVFTFIPFGIVNYILTSKPIVTYNNSEIIGQRVLSIPVEDFIYSFVLISFYIYFYELRRK